MARKPKEKQPPPIVLTPDEEKIILLDDLARLTARQKLYINYKNLYDPQQADQIGVYKWQKEFHDAGATYSTRVLLAGNRVGKSRTCAAECAMHLIGKYPPWWQGKRYNKPIKLWCGSTTNEKSRDVVQEALLGPVGEWGTGWVPAEKILGKPKTRQAGIPDVVDSFHVLHSSGGYSKCILKTYEQGREAWQGSAVDVVWMDEEAPKEVWSEAVTRTVDTNGMMILSFTPLLGETEVVYSLLHADEAANIYVKNVTWDDAPHLDEGKKAELKATYTEQEIEARTKGHPYMGRGRIFPIADSDILVDQFQLPNWWTRINGIDFGMDHPTAGAFCAYDRDADTFYLYDCYKTSGQTPTYHAKQMKKHGEWIPTAWPRDGLQRDKGSGIAIRDQYIDNDLYMLKENAHYQDERGEHVEPGLMEMLDYMKAGKFKVFRGICEPFMEELRMYHRDEKGLIVKVRDDIISATRYAFVMRRYASLPVGKVAVSRAPAVPILGRR